MDASTLAKSAKALILASGLIVASTVVGAAQDAPVPLGTTATVALNSWYVTPPSGQALLGGHTFDLSGGNLILLANGQSVSFTGSYAGVKGAYLLLNSSNTYSYYVDSAVGQVVLTFSDGTTQSTDLIVGTNLREWRISAGATVSNASVASAAYRMVRLAPSHASAGDSAHVADRRVHAAKAQQSPCEAMIITGYASLDSAVMALQIGACVLFMVAAVTLR